MQWRGKHVPRIEGGRDNAVKSQVDRSCTPQFADEEHLLDADLVGGHLHRQFAQHDLLLAKTVDLARRSRGIDDIHQEDLVRFLELVGHHDPEGAAVIELNIVRQLVLFFHVLDEMDAETFVGKDQVAGAENKDTHFHSVKMGARLWALGSRESFFPQCLEPSA